jgi:hypothetical protein
VLRSMTTIAERDEVVQVELGASVLETDDVVNLQLLAATARPAALTVSLPRQCSHLLPSGAVPCSTCSLPPSAFSVVRPLTIGAFAGGAG